MFIAINAWSSSTPFSYAYEFVCVTMVPSNDNVINIENFSWEIFHSLFLVLDQLKIQKQEGFSEQCCLYWIFSVYRVYYRQFEFS